METTNKIRNKTENILKTLVWVLFILYIVICVKIMIFKYTSINAIFQGDISRIRSLNLIPFKTIMNFYKIAKNHGAYLWAFSNIFGNIIIIIPLGYCIPLLIKKIDSPKKVFLITIIFSLFIEMVQYISYMGAADIDDLICNTLGGLIGCYIFRLIQKYIVKKKVLYLFTISGAILIFISGFIIAKEQFGSLLGLANFKTVYEGEENIPNRHADFTGTLYECNNDKLFAYDGLVSNPDDPIITYTTKKTFAISKDTLLYTIKYKTNGLTTTISYLPINYSDINLENGFARLQLWEDSYHNISLAVIDTRYSELMNNGQINSSTSITEPDHSITTPSSIIVNNQENEITDTNKQDQITPLPTNDSDQKEIPAQIPDEEKLEGYIKAVYEDYIEIEIVSVDYIENLGYISSTTGITVKAQFDQNTSYTLQVIKDGGFDVTTAEGSKDDLKKDYRVKMYGYNKGELFIAKEIIISIIK